MMILNGLIKELYCFGYGCAILGAIDLKEIIKKNLEGWKKFCGLDDWEKDLYSFDINKTPGSPCYFSEEKGGIFNCEYLYINNYFEQMLTSNDVDFSESKEFFQVALQLKETFYYAALQIARAMDQENQSPPYYENLVKKNKDIGCLRFFSHTPGAYETFDTLKCNDFFIGLQLYKSGYNINVMSYLGQKAIDMSNGKLKLPNKLFALSGSDEVIPIRCYF